MDIHTVESFRLARDRADLALAPGERIIAGGTWLMSEPLPGVTGFVDVTTMGWRDLEAGRRGLVIGATCTLARLLEWSVHEAPRDWTALQVVPDAVNALLASFKVWNTATVGGNVCRSFAAGSMVSLAAGLDGVAVIWTTDAERRLPVAELVTGNGSNSLGPDEVLRAVELPASALRSRMLLRKIALAELGRSGAVVTGRVDPDGSTVFGVTAATLTPHVVRFAALPGADELADAVGAATDFYTDPLGVADWRRAVSIVLAEDIRRELATGGDA